MVDPQGVGDDVPALRHKGAQVSDALRPPALNQPVNIPEPPDPPSVSSDRHVRPQPEVRDGGQQSAVSVPGDS